MPTIQREIRKRGFFGNLFKFLFIGFNVLMVLWVVSAIGGVSQSMKAIDTDAGRVGGAIGAGLGFTIILFLWVAGDIILGLFTLFTRGERILITEERP